MGGKAGILLVIGLSAILGYISLNVNDVATKAVSNMSMYNVMTASHNLALAGANARLARFYQDTSDFATVTKTFSGSNFTGSYKAGVEAVSGNRLRMRCVSTYPMGGGASLHDTVDVYFDRNKKNSFTLFAWMTDFEGNVFWISKDTVWGRVHSNGNLHINGSPVFMQKATTAKGFDPPKVGKGTNQAIFKDNYETGIAPIKFPNDLSELVTASVGGGRKYIGDIYVTLSPGTGANNDGKAYIRSGNTSSGALIDSIDLNDVGFNGVILGTGKVNVEGTLDGKLTLASSSNVYIQDDVLYERNPRFGASDDVLGLVAEDNVIIKDNAANNSECEIHGSIFTRDGSFTAENYNSLPICGELRVLGSIVQKERGAVGTFSGGVLNHGFSKRYRYDDRLSDQAFRPPYYPGYYVTTYAITNWWESYRVMQFE
ncbi:MAG: hypothetical protein IT282_05875 [Bacteroidetes bacterium]|nr:hypothetical protein [Bacteroidota bacterium]